MRIAYLATILIWLCGLATAFEIEDQRNYPVGNGNAVLKIISTADIDAFEPIIIEFQKRNPTLSVNYTIASSSELMKAIYEEGADFDLAISSAMDLQTKIANDGLAASYSSASTDALPEWAKWRDQVFGFTQEPAVIVLSDAYFQDIPPPENREDLIELLRDHQELFRGKIGTYDVRTSGLGYLFATQDARNGESFWRLTEVMGRLETRLYCCSRDMIKDVASGEIAIAYNVLGSYASSQVGQTEGIKIVELNDFLSVMLRTALIPKTAKNQPAAHAMIDFLALLNTNEDLSNLSSLPPIDEDKLSQNNALRPIRLGPGLLVFLDRLKREAFLRSWRNAIEQH